MITGSLLHNLQPNKPTFTTCRAFHLETRLISVSNGQNTFILVWGYKIAEMKFFVKSKTLKHFSQSLTHFLRNSSAFTHEVPND
jgi:hypothetical protein